MSLLWGPLLAVVNKSFGKHMIWSSIWNSAISTTPWTLQQVRTSTWSYLVQRPFILMKSAASCQHGTKKLNQAEHSAPFLQIDCKLNSCKQHGHADLLQVPLYHHQHMHLECLHRDTKNFMFHQSQGVCHAFLSFPTFQMSQNQWHSEKLHHISLSRLNSVCASSFPPSLYSLDFHILKKRWRCIITFAQQHSLESACHSLKCKMNITFFAQQQSLEAACMECKFMLQSIFFQIVFSSMN